VDPRPDDVSLAARVRQVLADEVAPLLAMEGGDIEVLGVERGVVRVRLAGTVRCPGTAYVVIMELEQEVRRRVPGVEYLEVAS
jgi:Fe-S cluster biogenesis protein NfuA